MASRLNFKHADTRFLIGATLLVGGVALGFWLLWPGAVSVVTMILALVLILARQTHLYRSRQDEDREQLAQMQALLHLYQRIDFRAPLPALTGWAASPQLVNTIYRLIEKNRPGVVLEIGSGASTLVGAYALEQVGQGQFISLDHDGAYTQRTIARLKEHDLEAWARVIHAPLQPVDVGGQTRQWYDLTQLEPARSIDMLVIDGPPAKTQEQARYPALPLLWDRLSPRAIIVLDDADRPGEQETIRQWQARFKDLKMEYVESPKGIAILRRGS